jgi:ABC-type transport system involved in multi-copper enzyme maturation permease subunit
MITYALLVTSLLFGGMTLYSFAFAAFLFSSLPADTASALIRKAFPHFYIFVLVTSAIAAVTSFSSDPISAVILVSISVTTILARQVLMPMINAATDATETTVQRTARRVRYADVGSYRCCRVRRGAFGKWLKSATHLVFFDHGASHVPAHSFSCLNSARRWLSPRCTRSIVNTVHLKTAKRSRSLGLS